MLAHKRKRLRHLAEIENKVEDDVVPPPPSSPTEPTVIIKEVEKIVEVPVEKVVEVIKEVPLDISTWQVPESWSVQEQMDFIFNKFPDLPEAIRQYIKQKLSNGRRDRSSDDRGGDFSDHHF